MRMCRGVARYVIRMYDLDIVDTAYQTFIHCVSVQSVEVSVLQRKCFARFVDYQILRYARGSSQCFTVRVLIIFHYHFHCRSTLSHPSTEHQKEDKSQVLIGISSIIPNCKTHHNQTLTHEKLHGDALLSMNSHVPPFSTLTPPPPKPQTNSPVSQPPAVPPLLPKTHAHHPRPCP